MASKKGKNKHLKGKTAIQQQNPAPIPAKGNAVKSADPVGEDKIAILTAPKLPELPEKQIVVVKKATPVPILVPPVVEEVKDKEDQLEGFIIGTTPDGKVKVFHFDEEQQRGTIYLGHKVEQNFTLYQVVKFNPKQVKNSFLADNIVLTNKRSEMKEFVSLLEYNATVQRPKDSVTLPLYTAFSNHKKGEIGKKGEFKNLSVYAVMDGRVVFSNKTA